MIALGVGTGVGINTDMAYYLGIGKKKKAEEVAGTGTPLGLILWIILQQSAMLRCRHMPVCQQIPRK